MMSRSHLHVLRIADGPPGEGAGALLDVLLGIVAHAHGEELEDLSPIVLVDRSLMVILVVQPDDHRRVPGQLHQQSPEASHPVASKHSDLVVEDLTLSDLRIRSGEDAMPEQGQLLL